MADILDELTDIDAHLSKPNHERLLDLFQTLGISPKDLREPEPQGPTGIAANWSLVHNTKTKPSIADKADKKWKTPIADLAARLELIEVQINADACDVSKNTSDSKHETLVDRTSKAVYSSAVKYNRKPSDLIAAFKQYLGFSVMGFYCRSNRK